LHNTLVEIKSQAFWKGKIWQHGDGEARNSSVKID